MKNATLVPFALLARVMRLAPMSKSFVFEPRKRRASAGSARTALGVAALLCVSPAFAKTIAITGGTVAIGDGSEPISGGTVVITDGKIVAAGAGVAVPAGAERIDATGQWVTPGIVSGYSQVGLVEVEGVDPTNDGDAPRSLYTAAIDVSPAVNPLANPVAINRSAGVTRAVVAPGMGSGIFAGQGAIVDLGADMDPVTKARAFQYVEMSESGVTKAGGSRPALFLTFRNLLREAQDYARNPAGYDGRSRDNLLLRPDAEALVPVVKGQVPLLVHVERGRDILSVLDLRKDFPALKLVLVGAGEGWTVASQIAAAKVPVIAAGLTDLPASFDVLAATQSNVGRMVKAGVLVALGQVDGSEATQLRWSLQKAGNLVALSKLPGAAGLSWGEALRTITSAPAEAVGMGDRIGSLKAGHVADVVLWDGDPLELESAPLAVWIDGVAQPMENRQTKLRDRYATPGEGNLPKAYGW